MTKYTTALYKRYPDASIATEASVQDGYVIVKATIMAGAKVISSAVRICCCPAEGGVVDSMDAARDAIFLAGVMTDNEVEPVATPEAAGVPTQEDSSSGGGTDEVAPSVEPDKPEGGGELQEEPPAAPKPAEDSPTPKGDEGPTSDAETLQREKKKARTRKKPNEAASPEKLEEARMVKMTFASDEASSKAPLNMRRQEGVSLGEIADAYPHFIRYLTQPAGRAYIAENVAAAAEIIMQSMN